MEFTLLDIAILGLISISIFFGFRKGLIAEMFWIIGIAVGLILATYYQGNLLSFIETRLNIPLVTNKPSAFIIILLSSILIFGILNRFFTFASRGSATLSFGDRVGGAFLGLVRGLIIVSFILMLILKSHFLSSLSTQIYQSELSRSILKYSLKVYMDVLRIFPRGKTFSHVDMVSDFIPKGKIERLEKVDTDIFQEFLDNLLDFETGKEIIPEQVRKLKEGGEK